MSRRRQSTNERVLIIGGGRAGVSAAEELRRQGFAGEVVIMCDETDAPYDRPACSKGLLTGHLRARDIKMPVSRGAEITWRLGRRAIFLDPINRMVETDTEEAYPYDGLVIATGSHGVAPRGWPVGQQGLHLLHRVSDAWALRGDLRAARRVAVVGAGLTGCEAAYAVRSLARDCVLIDSNPQVMTRALGETAGGFVTEEIRREGVDIRLRRRVDRLTRSRQGWNLVLDDGSEVQADVVVATTGERPDTEWLASAGGLDLSDGVLCDESLRVVGVNGVVAAGAVARWPNLRYSEYPRRCGQWIAALEMGRAAARTLLAGDAPVPPVTLLPRYWSDQFGLRIQVCGEMPAEADVFVDELRPGRRSLARGGVMVSYYADDRLIGLVAVNSPHAFTSLTRSLLVTPKVAPRVPVPVRQERYLAAVS